jgi:hypothetical protein
MSRRLRNSKANWYIKQVSHRRRRFIMGRGPMLPSSQVVRIIKFSNLNNNSSSSSSTIIVGSRSSTRRQLQLRCPRRDLTAWCATFSNRF